MSRHGAIRWTKAKREAFLDHLAATCNVARSAEVAGVLKSAVYRLRRRDPGFADAWAEALVLGYQMLETMVVGHVLAGKTRGQIDIGPDEDRVDIDLETAIGLLTKQRNATGKPSRGGRQRQFAEADDTDAMLLKRLKAIELRRAREAEWAARLETGKMALPTQDAGTDAPAPTGDTVIDYAPESKAMSDGK
ncbi:hypothetical protein J2Y54_001683 [Sphingomonas sp. BE123]|uniref:hypothetical protein n=1 Tax=Sphingomonas sp. BE123 TaxID=2817842 RepID=UPI0028608867|nr:hypothetical protein [Sphingomonas sp. BE123]MDR6852163.1 hypothetical protein [Sphingomonas sp. BE123]